MHTNSKGCEEEMLMSGARFGGFFRKMHGLQWAMCLVMAAAMLGQKKRSLKS